MPNSVFSRAAFCGPMPLRYSILVSKMSAKAAEFMHYTQTKVVLLKEPNSIIENQENQSRKS
jgi:hypothetical protein